MKMKDKTHRARSVFSYALWLMVFQPGGTTLK